MLLKAIDKIEALQTQEDDDSHLQTSREILVFLFLDENSEK